MEATKTKQQSILTIAVKMSPHSFVHRVSVRLNRTGKKIRNSAGSTVIGREQI